MEMEINMNTSTVSVTKSNATYMGTEGVSPVYLTEASTIGLRPGDWPLHLDTNLGNGQTFVRKQRTLTPDGEVLDVRYEQEFGTAVLQIIND